MVRGRRGGLAMSLQEIYNILIAAIPSLTAIVTVLALAVKIITSLVAMKRELTANKEASVATINELKLENQALTEQTKIMQKEIRTLTNNVNRVINKVDTNEQI